MLTKSERATALRERFGDLLTMSDLAAIFRYSSVGAIHKARSRGQLPVPVVQMPPRRGWFATAEAVAEVLCALDRERQPAEKDD
jgi:hypothetical protein